jgi:hypothetical protein
MQRSTTRIRRFGLVAGAALSALIAACAGMGMGQKSDLGFFVTSTGPGKGADLGGLAGADRQCQTLAAAVGAGSRTWHAYLSTTGPGGVNARDRIGSGPWKNAKGVVIAENVEQLHSANNNITKQTALTEKGEPVNGIGDTPNMHDILTGSQPDGRAFPPDKDTTCSNWTSSGEGSAFLGHHDRRGTAPDESAQSWNSSHASRGCSQEGLRSTGGNGLLYCFAAQ